MAKKFKCSDCGKKFDFKEALSLHKDARHGEINMPRRLALAKKSIFIYASLTVILIIILAVSEYIR